MATKTEKLPKTDAGWQAWLQNVKPPETRRWIAMGGGLTVCLEEGGGKTFQARVRRVGDKNPRRITVGHFPECTVVEARQRVSETRAAAKEGRDPALARRRAREGLEEIATFGALADLYLTRRAESGRLRPKTIAMEEQAVAVLRRALGDRLLSDIAPRDIAAVVEREAARLRKNGKTGRAANIMLAVCKQIFRDARGVGVFTLPSPAAELKAPAKSRTARAHPFRWRRPARHGRPRIATRSARWSCALRSQARPAPIAARAPRCCSGSCWA